MSELQSALQEVLRGRYVVDRQVGMGGMGVVFVAHDLKHSRQVAIKVMRPELADALDADRFVREIMTAARMTHPGILPVHDSGSRSGMLYYVMPYVEEGSLRRLLDNEERLPVEKAIRFTTELGEALAHAHGHGIVHRDLKPENILLEGGRPVIADFGVALAVGDDTSRDSGYGIAVGTPYYASPEQATGSSHIDGRADLYSLACVLYEMLAGDPPFTGPTNQAILARKVSGTVPRLRIVRPTVPKRVEQVIARAISPVPADRFDSVEQFVSALNTATRPAARWVAVAAAAILVTALGVGSVVTRNGVWIDPNVVVVDEFADYTSDEQLAGAGKFVADWITQGLHGTRLARVVPTPSALQASGFVRREAERSNADPLALLARETGAGLIVSGSYYYDAEQLTFQVQLSRASVTLWQRLVRAGVRVELQAALDPVTVRRDSVQQAFVQVRARVMGWLASSHGETDFSAPELELAPPTFRAYERFTDGMESYITNDFPEAVAAFLDAYQQDTTFVVALLYAALNASNMRQYARADSLLGIVALSADRLTSYHRLWLEFRQALLSEDRPRALRAIRALAIEAPRSKATYNLAIEAWEDGHLEEALEALQSLTPDIGPVRGFLSYWGALANVHHLLGHYRAALEVSREAREVHQGMWWPVGWELAAMAALGQVDQVVERSAAMAAQPLDDMGRSPAQAMREGAEELQARGHVEAARAVWVQALRWYESQNAADSLGVADRLGWAHTLYALGEYDEAARMARALHNEFPELVEITGLLGSIAARQGDSTTAIQILNQLEGIDESYQFGRPEFQAALIAAVLGDDRHALRLLRRARAAGLGYGHWVHRELAFAELRQTPAFQVLTRPIPLEPVR